MEDKEEIAFYQGQVDKNKMGWPGVIRQQNWIKIYDIMYDFIKWKINVKIQ